jgi:hypothetical protein
MNRRRLFAMAIGAVTISGSSAHAFFEEGNDHPSKLGYMKCPTSGDLARAELNGCNPWPDNDSSYSYKGNRDSKKSSVHYNLTMALAVAAGFDRCAAYVIGLYNEVTDYATSYDLEFWAPFPAGVSLAECADIFEDEELDIVAGQQGPGASVITDFTQRSFANPQDNEIERESYTFHWNLTLSSISDQTTTECSDGASNPAPLIPNKDMLTLHDLQMWAVHGADTLHMCEYADTHGPIARYNPDTDPADPGSLGALGVYLHSLMDSYSHRACGGSTHNFGLNTSSACGFASGHYAGEFGTRNGQVGSGPITVKTPARLRGYRISLHSDNTVSAALHTYQVLKDYLALRPELARGVQACDADVPAFAKQFAAIPNSVPKSGTASGAKKRSDLADSLFNSDNCSWIAQQFDPVEVASEWIGDE